MFTFKLTNALHLASIPLAIAYVVYFGCCIWCVLPYLIGFNIALWLFTQVFAIACAVYYIKKL